MSVGLADFEYKDTDTFVGGTQVTTVPVVLEGMREPLTLTGPRTWAEVALQARLEDGTKVQTRIIITYIGVQVDGSPVLRVTPKINIERPFKKSFDDEGYDGPVLNRGR